MIVIIAGIVVVLILLAVISIANSLIGKKNQVENALAGIDVQLKKRCDLIPNLVAGVQQYMQYEQKLLTSITELRSRVMDSTLPAEERLKYDAELGGQLRALMVQVENYPELKASENMMQLQRALNEVEEQIAAIRRTYNASVTDYNNTVEMIPSCWVAQIMNYRRRELYQIPEAERANVDVKQLFQR